MSGVLETVELLLGLRKQLHEAGLDAGADTIGWHLTHHHSTTLSRATINQILARAGALTPEPKKRPKNSYIRLQADQPNECLVPGLMEVIKPRRPTDGNATEVPR